MLALWIYSRRVKLKFLTVLDNIAIANPLAGCFIDVYKRQVWSNSNERAA